MHFGEVRPEGVGFSSAYMTQARSKLKARWHQLIHYGRYQKHQILFRQLQLMSNEENSRGTMHSETTLVPPPLKDPNFPPTNYTKPYYHLRKINN